MKEERGMSLKDKIYREQQEEIEPFSFDDAVADVFQDMIERSVPGYALTLDMISLVTRRYAQDFTKAYDLGCSLGASTFAMRHGIANKGCEIIAIDNSAPMIERLQGLLETAPLGTPVQTICDDIRNVPILNASLVTLNFTLQFIPPEERLFLMKRIYEGLENGGALFISEKIRFPDEEEQDLQTELHHSFKRAQGYSTLEIAQKRTSLEQVLIADTLDEHRKRLTAAGFHHVYLWFQCFSFVSLIAHE